MRCDSCGKFRSDIKPVIVAIHYSLGPISQLICASCGDSERDAGLTFRAAINETTEES